MKFWVGARAGQSVKRTQSNQCYSLQNIRPVGKHKRVAATVCIFSVRAPLSPASCLRGVMHSIFSNLLRFHIGPGVPQIDQISLRFSVALRK